MELLLRNNCPGYFYGIFFRNISRKNILKNVLKVVNFVHLLPQKSQRQLKGYFGMQHQI